MISAARYGKLAAELGVRAEAEHPLAGYTTWRIGGPADWAFFPTSMDHAARLYASLLGGPLPVRIIGGGSNLLIPDAGVRAAVILTGEMKAPPERLDETRHAVAAGAAVPGLARWAQRSGLTGLEFAEGIPAQLGGAIRMNAGANRSWFSDVIESVLVATEDGLIETHSVHEGDFGYRESFVGREDRFALGAILRLERDDPETIRERMAAYRERRRSTQPVTERSAGCVFANLEEQSVGALVDHLGLKGTRVGDAEISTIHGNFIINHGSASAADVRALIERIRQEIVRAVGVEPRLEIEIWEEGP